MGCVKQDSHCPEIDPRWTYEYVSSLAPSEILLAAKDFTNTPEVDAHPGETQPGFIHMMAYDALMNGPMFLRCICNVFMITSELRHKCEDCTMITPKFEDFLNRVSIGHEFRESVTPPLALPSRS